MTESLNELMQFDHVIRVHADGTISEPRGIHAPDMVAATQGTEDLDGLDGWEALTGWTGQYGGARSAVMHNSEYIGGHLEDHIRETPGYYVAAVVYWPNDIQCDYCREDIREDDQGAWINSEDDAVCSGDDRGDNAHGAHEPPQETYTEGWVVLFREAEHTCSTCEAKIDPLAVFPGGICVDCYAKTPVANAPITAEELAVMWGAPRRKA